MKIIFDFLGSIIRPIIGIFDIDAETRKIKTEGRHKIASAKINLKVAKINAKSKIEDTRATNDISYDMQVLMNRSKSVTDDILLMAFVLLVICHFIPPMQPYMRNGWDAMGYSHAPWWLEFGIVGILVSTLGLMGVIRLFCNVIPSGFRGKKDAENK
jgi:hypothetical protein